MKRPSKKTKTPAKKARKLGVKKSGTELETKTLAKKFAESLAPANVAVVVALHGDLGSGKTTFTQAAAAALGVSETVNSPTFVIQKKYALPEVKSSEKSKASFKHLIHIDAYRLNHPDELVRLGWNDLITDPSNLIFVEWPERVASILPPSAIKIHFAFINESSREIIVGE